MDKFIPAPNQPPLVSIYELLNKAQITQETINESVEDWDENNPDYDGLLTAEIKSEDK
jgi:hypothetical protein